MCSSLYNVRFCAYVPPFTCTTLVDRYPHRVLKVCPGIYNVYYKCVQVFSTWRLLHLRSSIYNMYYKCVHVFSTWRLLHLRSSVYNVYYKCVHVFSTWRLLHLRSSIYNVYYKCVEVFSTWRLLHLRTSVSKCFPPEGFYIYVPVFTTCTTSVFKGAYCVLCELWHRVPQGPGDKFKEQMRERHYSGTVWSNSTQSNRLASCSGDCTLWPDPSARAVNCADADGEDINSSTTVERFRSPLFVDYSCKLPRPCFTTDRSRKRCCSEMLINRRKGPQHQRFLALWKTNSSKILCLMFVYVFCKFVSALILWFGDNL